MIENFLRVPRGPAQWIADVLRAFGAFSIVVALILFDVTDAGILAFVLPGLLVPRFVGLRAGPDILFAVTLLVAAWSNVFDLYALVVGWDLIVHFVATGALAAVAYLLLARLDILPLPAGDRFEPMTGIVVTAALGLALSALWEMVEWVGHTYISDQIFVTYDDTIADMAFGGLGALVAGVAVAFVRLLRSDVGADSARSAQD
jgi:hypothetical protein